MKHHDVPSQRQRGIGLFLKRAIDISVACVLLGLLAPLLALVAVAIHMESRGPAIFRQTRIGRGGQPFTMLKFRSMYQGADERLHERYVTDLLRGAATTGGTAPHIGGPTRNDPRTPAFKLAGDPRITRVGAVIRRLSIDELPQLVNVVRGDMSLVGPRPDVEYAVKTYEPWHWRRFEVLPGLSGLWQVSGRGELSPIEMLRLDVEYVDRWSLWLDLRLLLATIPAVVRNVGSA